MPQPLGTPSRIPWAGQRCGPAWGWLRAWSLWCPVLGWTGAAHTGADEEMGQGLRRHSRAGLEGRAPQLSGKQLRPAEGLEPLGTLGGPRGWRPVRAPALPMCGTRFHLGGPLGHSTAQVLSAVTLRAERERVRTIVGAGADGRSGRARRVGRTWWRSSQGAFPAPRKQTQGAGRVISTFGCQSHP